jgi:hypothetical protein
VTFPHKTHRTLKPIKTVERFIVETRRRLKMKGTMENEFSSSYYSFAEKLAVDQSQYAEAELIWSQNLSKLRAENDGLLEILRAADEFGITRLPTTALIAELLERTERFVVHQRNASYERFVCWMATRNIQHTVR